MKRIYSFLIVFLCLSFLSYLNDKKNNDNILFFLNKYSADPSPLSKYVFYFSSFRGNYGMLEIPNFPDYHFDNKIHLAAVISNIFSHDPNRMKMINAFIRNNGTTKKIDLNLVSPILMDYLKIISLYNIWAITETNEYIGFCFSNIDNNEKWVFYFKDSHSSEMALRSHKNSTIKNFPATWQYQHCILKNTRAYYYDFNGKLMEVPKIADGPI